MIIYNPRAASIKLSLLVVILVIIICAEYYAYSGHAPPPHPAPAPPPIVHSVAPLAAVPDVAGSIEAILARPLFQADRRPGVGSGKSVGRLTAILISQGIKLLIFAGTAGGKPIIAAEGDHIGLYTVQFIAAEHAILLGPEGMKTVNPVFDKSEVATKPAEVPGAAPIIRKSRIAKHQ